MQIPDTEPEKKSPAKPQRILMVNEQRSFQVMMKAMLINIGISNITFSNSAEDARRRSPVVAGPGQCAQDGLSLDPVEIARQ